MSISQSFLIPFYCLLTFLPAGQDQCHGKDCAQNSMQNPSALLQHATEVMHLSRAAKSIIHYHSVTASEQNYQSDRTYPPFFSAMEVEEQWFDSQSGTERITTETTFPGGKPPISTTVTTSTRVYRLDQGVFTAMPLTSMATRYLNPAAVLHDWIGSEVRFGGSESYRDYPRYVLLRETPAGSQRLFLDPKTGFPVKLEMEEKHYLWGQRHIEYVYSNWILANSIILPGSSFRLADGDIELSRTTSDADLISTSAVPSQLPPQTAQAPPELPSFLEPIDPKITQIGPKTYLFTNPGYSEAVTEIGDEVFVFDATQGAERAEKDAALITQLFPESKKITVVITDLAWPHVAGVRFWVANGATIVSHAAARVFLESVINRRWTLTPDLLEQRRASVKLNFIPVDRELSLGGGAISLHAIDGIGSEVALMAYLPADDFLWASDYIQTTDTPTLYTSEVWQAAKRDGLHPGRVAAEHLPLTPWSKIEELQK
jgi:hypothetical protein